MGGCGRRPVYRSVAPAVGAAPFVVDDTFPALTREVLSRSPGKRNGSVMSYTASTSSIFQQIEVKNDVLSATLSALRDA